MATNLTSHFVSATTTIDSNAGRIRGYNFTSHSTAVKSVVFQDNYVSAGDTGTQVLKFELNSGGSNDTYLEDAGIRYFTNLHVTVPTSVAGTVFTG